MGNQIIECVIMANTITAVLLINDSEESDISGGGEFIALMQSSGDDNGAAYSSFMEFESYQDVLTT